MSKNGLCLTAEIPESGIVATYEIKISVVIPTYNAGKDFPELMMILARQIGIRDIQMIIVDSGSSDETVETAKWFRADVIEIPNEEFSHSYARNLGAAKADGDYILFMTQDAMPTDDYWLYRLASVLVNHQDIAAVSPIELPNGRGDLKFCADGWHNYKCMNVLDCDKIGALPENQDYFSLRYNAVLCDVTCLIRRDIYMRFPYEGDFAEDLRLALQLLRAGYKEAQVSSVGVLHSHSRSIGYYMKRSFIDSRTLLNMFGDFPHGNYAREALIGNFFESLKMVNGVASKISETDVDAETAEEKLNAIIGCIKRDGIEEGEAYIPDDFVQSFLSDFSGENKNEDLKYLTYNVVKEQLEVIIFPYAVSVIDGYDPEKLKKDLVDSVYKIYASHIGCLTAEYAKYNEENDELLKKWIPKLSGGV